MICSMLTGMSVMLHVDELWISLLLEIFRIQPGSSATASFESRAQTPKRVMICLKGR